MCQLPNCLNWELFDPSFHGLFKDDTVNMSLSQLSFTITKICNCFNYLKAMYFIVITVPGNDLLNS